MSKHSQYNPASQGGKASKISSFFSKAKTFFIDDSLQGSVEAAKVDEGDEFNKYLAILKEKIKPFLSFKSAVSAASESEVVESSEDDNFNLDFGRATAFVSTHSMFFFLILILVLQLVPNSGFLPWGGLWMRLQTQDLLLLEDFAQNSVYSFYRNQVAGAVEQQYPNLPQDNKNKIIDEQLGKALKDNSAQVDEQIRQTAEFLKDSERYEEGGKKYTMMPDIDPYQYLRFARNYLDYGVLGDSVKNNVSWDSKVLAPLGRSSANDWELHPYTLVYLHKFMRIFNAQIPLMQSASYFPIIFVAFAVAFAFLFVSRFTNITGGLFAATIMSVSAAGIGRTQWGHANTNAYNLFFPILISWIFVESIESEDFIKKNGLILLNTLILGVYSFAWNGGWWYVFEFILGAVVVQILYALLFNRNKLSESITTFAVYFVGTGIFTTIIRNFNAFIESVAFGPLRFNQLFKAAAHEDWSNYLFPNVYTTVAELNSTDLSGAINAMGGAIFLVICILGLLLLFFKKDASKRKRAAYLTFFILWLVATVYATIKGIRFGILIVPVMASLFGIAVGLVVQKCEEFNRKNWNLKQIFVPVAVLFVFAAIIVQSGQVESAYSQSKNDLPIMNKAWWSALTKIKDNSKSDAIINSWWDFGHHFKYVADRAVTFDGAHQNSPMAHWIGKVLLTSDEDEAVALLRMLDCGSRSGYDVIFSQSGNDTIKAVKTLQKILSLSRDDARKYLVQNKVGNADKILNLTHCNPPEDFFITSEDMVGKAGVWSHFGGWDFEKAYAWINLRDKSRDVAVNDLVQKLNFSVDRAEQLYSDVLSLKNEGDANTWISGWAGYLSGVQDCNVVNDTITCGNGAVINKKDMSAVIQGQGGAAKPRALSYIDEKTLKFTIKQFNDSNTDISIILVPVDSSYKSVLASSSQAGSMFTRLFYMDGHGLKHFKLFDRQRQIIGGGEIIVWKVDWNGSSPNVINALQPKELPKNKSVDPL